MFNLINYLTLFINKKILKKKVKIKINKVLTWFAPPAKINSEQGNLDIGNLFQYLFYFISQ